jgi:hypothetical protein
VARVRFRVVLAFALLVMPLCAGVWVLEELHARRGAANAIAMGMDRTQVVDLLGAMYDDCRPGEYPDVDARLSKMENRDAISYVATWRLAYSRGHFSVGFDDERKVVSTLME